MKTFREVELDDIEYIGNYTSTNKIINLFYKLFVDEIGLKEFNETLENNEETSDIVCILEKKCREVFASINTDLVVDLVKEISDWDTVERLVTFLIVRHFDDKYNNDYLIMKNNDSIELYHKIDEHTNSYYNKNWTFPIFNNKNDIMNEIDPEKYTTCKFITKSENNFDIFGKGDVQYADKDLLLDGPFTNLLDTSFTTMYYYFTLNCQKESMYFLLDDDNDIDIYSLYETFNSNINNKPLLLNIYNNIHNDNIIKLSDEITINNKNFKNYLIEQMEPVELIEAKEPETNPENEVENDDNTIGENIMMGTDIEDNTTIEDATGATIIPPVEDYDEEFGDEIEDDDDDD
jgi:hypothetical protein